MNTDLLKVVVFISSYLVLYFWIIKEFRMGSQVEKAWIGGAYLAFAIPLVLTITDDFKFAILGTMPLLLGCLYTKSTTAIVAAYSGVVLVFIYKKHYLALLILCALSLVGAYFFLPKTFREFPFRNEVWTESYKYKKASKIFRQKVHFYKFTAGLEEEQIYVKEKDRRRTGLDRLIGTGLRSYREYEFLEGKDERGGILITHPHNSFLECYCELGIVGLLIVVFFLVELFTVVCPIEYKAMLLAIVVHCSGYYADKLAMTGLLIIICIGTIESYRIKNNNV